MPIIAISRDTGVAPSIVRVTTTDTLAQITVAGYLNTQEQAIRAINFGPFEWVDGDLVSIDYADGEGYFTYDPTNSTFAQSGGGGGGAPVNAGYILKTPNGALSNAQAMSALPTGLVKNTTGTGVQTIAQPGLDYIKPNPDDSIDVGQGGTGMTQAIPYAPIVGGINATAPLQSVASVGTAGQVLTSNGPGQLPSFQPSGGGGSGANQSLSNLTSPTSINENLLPDGDKTRDLGSTTAAFRQLYTSEIRAPGTDILGATIMMAYNTGTTAWDPVAAIFPGATPLFQLYGNAQAITQPVASNNTSVATTKFVHDVVGASAANVNLSNLIAPTAVNQPLLPAINNATPLGSPTQAWGQIFANALNTPASGNTILQAYNTGTSTHVPVAVLTSGANPFLNILSATTTTQPPGTNNTTLASTAFVQQEITANAIPYVKESGDDSASLLFPNGPNQGGSVRIGGEGYRENDEDVQLNFPGGDPFYGSYGILLANSSTYQINTRPNVTFVPCMRHKTNGLANAIMDMIPATRIVSPTNASSMGFSPVFGSSRKSTTNLWAPAENEVRLAYVFIGWDTPRFVTIFVQTADTVAQAQVALYSINNINRAGALASPVSTPVSLNTTGEVVMEFEPNSSSTPPLSGFYWVAVRIVGAPTTLEINCCEGESINLFNALRSKEGEAISCYRYTGQTSLPSSLGGINPASYELIQNTPYLVVHRS